jgi:hypothetical protein
LAADVADAPYVSNVAWQILMDNVGGNALGLAVFLLRGSVAYALFSPSSHGLGLVVGQFEEGDQAMLKSAAKQKPSIRVRLLRMRVVYFCLILPNWSSKCRWNVPR